jgi:uncharacterized protein YndB with AHSA1/START domain
MVVTQVIDAPVGLVWEVFTDLAGRARWLSEVDGVEVLATAGLEGARWRETRRVGTGRSTGLVVEELMLTVVEPRRRCTVALAEDVATNELHYEFTPIELGAHRGSTLVTVLVAENRPQGLADHLLAFVVGGFAARMAEGAVRDELGALTSACLDRVQAGPAAA